MVGPEGPTTTLTPAVSGGLPRLSCSAAELPDPADAWAWAHVQIVHDAAVDARAALDDPTVGLSRVFCTRRLDPGIRYLACLVPRFAAGADAGLKPASPASDPLGPAWGPDGNVILFDQHV